MRSLALLGLIVCLGAPALAQEQELREPAAGELTDAQVRADMWKRLRDLERIRHPDGDETSAIGNEQEGNDLRSGTPALANSDREPAFLDSGELYDRSRAMIEDGATFTSAPRPVREIARPLARRAVPRDRSTVAPAPEPKPAGGGAAVWIVPLVVGGALGLIVYLRAKAKV